MNRRGFLKLFGAGLPAVVVAEKVGLVKYFFAPKAGWLQGCGFSIPAGATITGVEVEAFWDQMLLTPVSWVMPIQYTEPTKMVSAGYRDAQPFFYAGATKTVLENRVTLETFRRRIVAMVARKEALLAHEADLERIASL